MSKYTYLTSKELYAKLKRLLELDVKFGRHIRKPYFCIYAKSRIIAIKISREWFVNIDNWGITDKHLLPKLDIEAITPGSYAFKMMKESLKESRKNYNSIWPTLTNDINRIIKSGYNSGLLHAVPGFYNQPVYHYDLNGAYGAAFKEAEVPIGIPKIVEGYVKPDKDTLKIYCMELNVQYDSHKIFPYLVNSSDIRKLPSEIIDNTGYQSLYKVITETEFKDLKKDYDVIYDCAYTLIFNKAKGLFDNFVDKYHDLKNANTGDTRTVYKTILAALAGKLSQNINSQSIPIGVNEFGYIEYETVKIEDEDTSYLNPAVSLFIVDYVRKKVRDTIRKAGYKNIILVDTDGFISTKKLNIPYSKELGKWKSTIYENIIVNGKRSYFYTENGQFHSSISGLGDIYDDGLNYYNFKTIEEVYKLKQSIPVTKKVMYCGEEKYVSMNIHIGK